MPDTFTPNATNERLLRDAFGRFATGVTVVTVGSNDGPVGMTVNSFASLSINPALVFWCLSKSSRRFGYFDGAPHYAIHVLADHQADMCNSLVKNPFALANFGITENKQGVPLIANCLSRLECQHTASHPGGNHQIVVGQVIQAEVNAGNALGFLSGKLRAFGTPPGLTDAAQSRGRVRV